MKYEPPSKAVSDRMKKIKSSGTKLEKAMEKILQRLNVEYEKQPRLPGRPDFLIKGTNMVVFCDSLFWHGGRKEQFRKNKTFWDNKIAENKRRDKRVNLALKKLRYVVLRFWDDDILRNPDAVTNRLNASIKKSGNTRPKAIDSILGLIGRCLQR